MSLRIRLVEPRPPGYQVYGAVLLPRLGPLLIACLDLLPGAGGA